MRPVDPLLKELKQRAADPERANEGEQGTVAYPPASEAQIAAAQKALGFWLPPLLQEIYTTIGNGGFGPAYGLLGVAGGATQEYGHNCVELYEGFSKPDPADPHWEWPAQLLPIGHLGCGMFACIDCSSPEGPMVWFEPNPHCRGEPWGDSFIPLAPSLRDWLEQWLAGKDMLEAAWTAKFGAGEDA